MKKNPDCPKSFEKPEKERTITNSERLFKEIVYPNIYGVLEKT